MCSTLLIGENGFFSCDDVADYGCAGRGVLDPFAVTAGRQVDDADREFYAWKKCIQCAAGPLRIIPSYNYDSINDTCCKINVFLVGSNLTFIFKLIRVMNRDHSANVTGN